VGKKTTACKDCGLLLTLPLHRRHHQFRCPRCDGLIYRRGEPFGFIISMAVTTLILFIPLTFLPILDLDIVGLRSQATLFEAIWRVYEDGYRFIAIISMATGLLLPVAATTLLLAILVPLQLGRRPKSVARYYRLYETLLDWGMVEVYLIGVIVAIVKLHKMGTLHIGLGLIDFFFFALTFYITTIWFNPDDIWNDDVLQK